MSCMQGCLPGTMTDPNTGVKFYLLLFMARNAFLVYNIALIALMQQAVLPVNKDIL